MSLLPLLLSFIAGLGTLVGGIIVCFFFSKQLLIDKSLLLQMQAVSAGVMITLSFELIVFEAIPLISIVPSMLYSFIGLIVFILIHNFIPETDFLQLLPNNHPKNTRLVKTTVVTFLGMAVHNIPVIYQ